MNFLKCMVFPVAFLSANQKIKVKRYFNFNFFLALLFLGYIAKNFRLSLSLEMEMETADARFGLCFCLRSLPTRIADKPFLYHTYN